jgi:hypothetical protein
MTSYRIDIKQCPICNCEFAAPAVASRNTFGATFYTDGFVEGPMFGDGGALLTCTSCDRYLWSEEMPTMESIRDSDFLRDAGERQPPFATPVRGRGYEDALQQAVWKNTYASERGGHSTEPTAANRLKISRFTLHKERISGGCWNCWSRTIRTPL